MFQKILQKMFYKKRYIALRSFVEDFFKCYSTIKRYERGNYDKSGGINLSILKEEGEPIEASQFNIDYALYKLNILNGEDIDIYLWSFEKILEELRERAIKLKKSVDEAELAARKKTLDKISPDFSFKDSDDPLLCFVKCFNCIKAFNAHFCHDFCIDIDFMRVYKFLNSIDCSDENSPFYKMGLAVNYLLHETERIIENKHINSRKSDILDFGAVAETMKQK